MVTLLKEVKINALSLSPEQRAFLADRLLSLLRGVVLSDVDAAWVAEAERRYQEYKEGKRTPIPAMDVFAEADRLLK